MEGAGKIQTLMTEEYVPSGATSFSVKDVAGFKAGDVLQIRRPVTAKWVQYMGMDDLTRDGKAQTWIRAGTTIAIERKLAGIRDTP